MTERSDYQKLRAHLAFLRMGAAAEALPGLLDEAIRTKCSTQAFLEKLLSVEVQAVEWGSPRRMDTELRCKLSI